VGREHSVGQEITKLGLGPAMHNAVNDAMDVSAWVDVVRDARRDDRQDVAGARATLVEPREEPVLASMPSSA